MEGYNCHLEIERVATEKCTEKENKLKKLKDEMAKKQEQLNRLKREFKS